LDILFGFAAATELPRDEARQQIDGEQVIDPVQPTVALQIPQVSVRHLRAQRGQALISHLAAPHDLGAATEDRLREQLALPDLDHELTLQTEHDVQEAAHKLCALLFAFSTAAGDVASDLEDHAAQGRLEEARPLVEQLETMADELVRLASGLSLETLRQQTGPADDPNRKASPRDNRLENT